MLYRGQSSLSHTGELYDRGDRVKWKDFRTASLSREAAEAHAGGAGGYLFEITGGEKEMGACFAGTRPLLSGAASPDPNEILLPAGSSFEVKSKRPGVGAKDGGTPTIIVLEHKGYQLDSSSSSSSSSSEEDEDDEDQDEEVVGMGEFGSTPVAGEGLEEDGDGKREERVEGNEGGEEEAMTREELVAMMEGQGLDAEQMAAVLERYGD
jgi:hypothetical protein